MGDRIIHKRSLTAGSLPTTASLDVGELAINVADGKIHLRRSGSANNDIVSVVTAGTITTGSIQVTAGFTGSLSGTASWASNFTETDPIFVAKSASLATTGSNTFYGNQVINGNLNVVGTASFAYTTTSIVQVGASTITLNTDYPATRFGGISVIDSGSFGNSSTGSLFWDSLNNKWIYSNPSGSTYDSGMLISGPRNTNGLGNESGLTQYRVAVSQGSDHIQDSQIYSSGSVTIVTGSLTVTEGITGSLQGTASNATTASSADSFLVRNGITVNGAYTQDAGANSSPWVLNAYSVDSSFYAGVINAINGMAGFRVDTNGQAQYTARTSAKTDRELRFQVYSDGNCYFGMQGLAGTITSDLIIRTSADAGTNDGAIRFSLMGSNKMAVTPSGIRIGNTSDALSANATLDVSGSVLITGSLNVSNGLTGSLQGTASNAVSSSYADVAQNAPLYVLTSVTSSMLQPYVLTASTSSMLSPYVLTSVTSSMTVLSSSFATTASYISPTFISASAAASGFGSGGTGTTFPYTGSAYITGSLIVTGSINGSSDIIAGGDLKSNYSSGDEGGQIFLNKPVTNTAITGGVNFDIYQNRIRFFENGGTARGAYIDLTACAAGADTNLLSGGSGLTFNEVQRVAFLRI